MLRYTTKFHSWETYPLEGILVEEAPIDRFEIKETTEPWPTVTISGEIDQSNSRQARICVNRLLKEGSSVFIFDFTSVSFLDTAAVAVVFWAAQQQVDRGGQLRIVLPHGHVRRALVRYGIEGMQGTNFFDHLQLALGQ